MTNIRYNDKDFIENQSLISLETLKELTAERYTAGYMRRERLTEFVIGGKYVLDSCGNVCEIIEMGWKRDLAKLESVRRDAPKVMSFEQFSHKFGSMTYSPAGIPGPGSECMYCGEKWTIDNVLKSHSKFEKIEECELSLTEFEDMVLCDVLDKVNAVFVNGSKTIRVYRDGDMSYINSERAPNKTYVVKAGDKIYVDVYSFVHSNCHQMALNNKTREFFEKAFKEAGFSIYNLSTIKNEYGSYDYAGPWYEINTTMGTFTVGWRKNVISLYWPEGKDFSHLFASESTTLTNELVHCWGYTKLVEYLKAIRNSNK